MSTITDAAAMPRRIWIEPECCAGGDVTEQRWAEDDIFDCDEGARATEYVRADLVADMLEALKQLVAWQEPTELLAPQLGGLLKSMYAAKDVIAKAEGKE